MIVSFAYPSTPQYTGGVVVLYEYANGLARRDHEVHIIHGPDAPDLISGVDQLDWFAFDERVQHHIVSTLDDPGLPEADIILQDEAPRRLGLPAVLLQGYQMIAAKVERPAYRARCPKLCVATWLTDVGVAWGSPPEQMLYVPMGIDHDVFRAVTAQEERPVDVAILYNEHPVKGWDDGIAALERVRLHQPDLRVEAFSVVAPGHDVPDWIELHQNLDRGGLAALYNRAKVFVQPSWREGFGFTSVEAMASGCALVTTDNGGSRDYATDDETALVVPPRDPEALGDAVVRLLDDAGLRERLAAAGEDRVRRFDWDVGAEVLEGHLLAYLADPEAFRRPPGPAPIFLDGFP